MANKRAKNSSDSAHLLLLENLDRVNRAMQKAGDLNEMMRDVLDEVLDIFDCDRAFLLYPCDPDADSWSVPMERTKPEYPGAGTLKKEIPMTGEVAKTLRILLENDEALKFGTDTDHPLPQKTSERFGFKSFMSTALYPKTGKPWEFGIHQCSHDRIWTDEEERLLLEISYRLADGLTSLLIMRDLQQSEAKYRRFVETSNEGVCATDNSGLVTFMNEKMSEMLGYSIKEGVGKSLIDFMFKEDIADHEQHMAARRKGTSETYERRLRRKDGGELWALVSANAIYDGNGEFQGSFAMFNDITERKQAEQNIAARELDFRTLVENSSDPILRYNRDCRRVYINPVIHQISGKSLDSLLDHKPEEAQLLSKSEAKKLTAAIRKTFASDQPGHVEFEFIDLNDVPHNYDMLLIPEHDAGGQIKTVLGIARDITERKQAELALSLSEEKFSKAFQASPNLMAITRPEDGLIIEINESFCRFFGYTRDECIGHYTSELQMWVNPEQRDEAIRELEKNDEALYMQVDLRTKSGEIRSVIDSMLYINIENRKYLLSVATDITKHKRAEEALRSKHDQLSSIYAASPVGITVLDRNGQVIDANPQAEKVLGLKKSDILQLQYNTPAWSISDLDGSPFPDDQLPFSRVKATGKPVRDVQHAIQWPDGRRILLSINAEPLFDQSGQFDGMIASIEDITERRQAEEKLLQSEQRLRLHTELSPLGFLEWDENFCAVEWNAACERMFGYTRKEALGRHAKELILPAEMHDLVDGIFRDLMSQTGGTHSINENITKDGRTIIVEWFNTTLVDKEGKGIGVASICRDITEQKQAEKELTDARLLFEGVVEQSPIPMALAKSTGELIFNKACAEFLHTYDEPSLVPGISLQEMKQPWRDFDVDGNPVDPMDMPLARALRGESTTDLELKIVRQDGSEGWEVVNGAPIYNPEGELIAGFVTFPDITERKWAEEELKERQSQLIESQRIGHMGSWYMDLATNDVFWSEQLYKMYGYDPALPPPLYTESAKLFTPESWERLSTAIAQVAEGGAPYELELEMVTKEGSKWMLARGELVRDEQEKPYRIRGVVLDITDRKLAEVEISEKQAQLLEAQRIGKIGNWWHDLETDEIYWSDEWFDIIGLEPQKPSIELALSVIHPEDQPRLLQDADTSTNEEGEYEQEFRVIRPNGEIRWVHNRWIRVTDEDGKEIKRVGTHQDITERKVAEMELGRLNRELRAISDCNQALMKATDEQELLNEICNIIYEEAGYLLAWVGYAENDDAKTIRPVAWAGEGSDYIAKAKLSWSEDVKHGHGPAGEVIRSGKTIYVQDFEKDELIAPWRQSALQHGYRSGIALPLKDESGQPFGALLIYSGEKDAINPGEIRLMEELAGDLAYGIVNLRIRDDNKRTTEALAESEKLQRLLLDTLTQQVFYKDRDSHYIACNRTFANGLGMEPEELVGKSDFEIYPRELAERYRADDLTTMKSGKTIEVEEPYEASGEKFWVHTVKTPMRDSSGKVTGVLGIFWDITEQHRAARKLERSESRLAEAQRIAKLGNWELNLVTDELTWSDEMYEIFEIDKAEFGASYEAFLDAIHPDDRDMVDKAYTDSVKKHSTYEAAYRLLMKDGSIKFAQAQGRTDYDPDGKPLRSVGTVQDITHIREVEEQLHQAQKMEAIGTLVGGIAHDFNNKLAAITGNLYLALNKMDKDSELEKRLRVVERLSFEAARMVQQLLTFARKGKVEYTPLALESFIKEAVKLNRVAIPEDIQFSIDYDGNPLPVMGDVTQLQQLFLNLLTNARDAVKGVKEPRIEVVLQKSVPEKAFYSNHPEIEGVHAYACLKVIDNGVGIHPKDIDKVFDPFFTTKAVGEGSGLGLAMVYGIIQSHHGVVEVKSEPGKGSSFSIFIPLDEKEPDVSESGQQKQVVEGRGETILIADDDEHVLEALREVLSSINYHVLEARDGGEAVGMYLERSGEIDLVLLDIVMPVLKGPEVTEKIRALHPDAKILYCSGYDSNQNADAIRDGVTVLDKPFDLVQMSQAIRHVLDSGG